jgi:PAP2 superfamily.
MRNICWFALLINISFPAFSQEIRTIDRSQLPDSLSKDSTLYKYDNNSSYLYTRPKLGSFLKNTGNNFLTLPFELDKKRNLPSLVAVAALTALTLYYDEKIILASQRFGRYAGIKDDNPTISLSPLDDIPFYVPASLSSGLYYIGDGITELAIDGSFYLFGLIKSDNRALRTSCELSEGIATVGLYIQILKHMTGRETPMRRSQERGKWRLFVTVEEYSSSVPSYDAFPSGHLATAMMTVTVISMNYPEYKFIKPLGYTLMGICGYQMLNNGVHWMSDYPLAIAMGYAIGRSAVNRGRTKVVNYGGTTMHTSKKIKPAFNIQPVYMGYGATGVSLSLTF